MTTINFTSDIISADFEEDTVTFTIPKWTKLEWWRYQIVKL